jgi:hypothetical protein
MPPAVAADEQAMRALSIRQPWAELILRGVKTIEYRSRPTRIVGERFFLYASKQWAAARGQSSEFRVQGMRGDGRGMGPGLSSPNSELQTLNSPPSLASDNLLAAAPGPPGWMWELAEALILDGRPLPTGVLVGTAVIDRVTPGPGGDFHWHLVDVERLAKPRRPVGHPQPVWFRPFGGK